MDAAGIKGFGAAVKEHREHLGLSQAQLAERIGVSRQTVSHHETSNQEVGKINAGIVLAYERALELEEYTLIDMAKAMAEDTDE